MLHREQAQALLEAALREFAPDWDVTAGCTEVTLRNPDHWLSGIGTFGCTLTNRATGSVKVLGRRGGGAPGTAYHRGMSFLVLEAYADRNTDPIRRYLDEVGIVPLLPPPRPLVQFRTT